MTLELNLNLGSSFNLSKAPPLDKETLYDVLIIGGGPAGLNAALYSKRKGLAVGIIAKRMGGQVMDTSSVENYLGTSSASGEGLVQQFEDHVKGLQIPITSDVEVERIQGGRVKKVFLTNGSVYKSKTVILATGSKPRKLKVPGEETYAGKGVAYCAICDGPLFADLDVVVAGGGNSAVEAALDLSKTSSKVYLVHRSQLRADQILVDKLHETENIEVHTQTQITAVVGQGVMEGIEATHKTSGDHKRIQASGLFVEIGYDPNSDAFRSLVDLDDRGAIAIDQHNQTKEAGVFAAGDVTTVPYKQIIIAASEGAKAALSANEYIQKEY